ncbi:molybdopterin-dependent oxidoreductase [Roseomonas sp. BN140053]|uniref:molybdopterin-dependent oxidoreductase n=1 Tax=Roseomonas sp. BN140053 TaxID=3391898 RepID=UPI0039EBBB6B
MDRCVTRREIAKLLCWTAAASAVTPAQAATLPQPAERPILTVTGKISTFNEGNSARFDRPMLEALGMSSFVTTTPWYTGPVRFEGVLMSKLLETVGSTGERVVATALNDYSTEIPISDFAQYGVLLALKRDGEYMTVRDKGPLFIVYPFDSRPELKRQQFYGRSAWQLARLSIV